MIRDNGSFIRNLSYDNSPINWASYVKKTQWCSTIIPPYDVGGFYKATKVKGSPPEARLQEAYVSISYGNTFSDFM